MQLAGYTGKDYPVSESEQRVAGMTNYLFRVFAKDPANAFSVYVGYYESQTTGKTIHSPRNCLPGAGWQTLTSGRTDLDLGGRRVTVNRYLLADSTGQALVYYWYQGRGRIEASEYRVKWDLLRDAAMHGRTEEALVRVMVPVPRSRGLSASSLAAAQQRADSIAHAVAVQLVPTVDRVLPVWRDARAAGGLPRA
jgi:EpsI family protein